MTAPTSGLLAGKRLLITGIATTDSIAFATAASAQRASSARRARPRSERVSVAAVSSTHRPPCSP